MDCQDNMEHLVLKEIRYNFTLNWKSQMWGKKCSNSIQSLYISPKSSLCVVSLISSGTSRKGRAGRSYRSPW